MARIDAKIEQQQAEIARLQEARRDAWLDFLSGAHTYLMQRFKAEFLVLRATFLDPMLAIQNIKDAQHVPLINVRRHMALCEGSQVEVVGSVDGAWRAEKLLDFSFEAFRKLDSDGLMSELRSDLRAASGQRCCL